MPIIGQPSILLTARQSRALDRHAIDTLGINGFALMQRAAAGCYQCLRDTWPDARTLIVACGAGNNAGDGLLIASLARADGLDARLICLREPQSLTGDAALAWAQYQNTDGESPLTVSKGLSVLVDAPADAVIVDAVFGTGLDRAVEGVHAQLIDAINASERPVLSVDIPSGLNADTGRVMGTAVKADLTVTLIAGKRGLYTADGAGHCGSIVADDLDVPLWLDPADEQMVTRSSPLDLIRHLKPRHADSHKASYGAVAVLGGSPGMQGAGLLTAQACLRSGAGMVVWSQRPEQSDAYASQQPELMTRVIDSVSALRALIDFSSVVAIGPGMGLDAQASHWLDLACSSGRPLLIDADALTLLAAAPRPLTDAVLTPHPGEAARLLETTVAEVQSDRYAAARAIAERYRCVCVLKGAGTITATAAGELWVCSAGNPAMATAGMGDVLAGVISALMAQGLDAVTAAICGVQAHAMAGDRAAAGRSRGLVASDVIDQLAEVLNP